MSFLPLNAATADQVWDALARHIKSGPRTSIDAVDALGRVLAEDVRAIFDFPPFDRAAMDGYAVRTADFISGAATLIDDGLIQAGSPAPGSLAAGRCLRINTGAPMPTGADAVVIVEKSEPQPDGRVRLSDAPQSGQHFEPRGAVAATGDLLVRAGTRIDAGTLAALTAGGIDTVRAFARPRVGLISTGDELVQRGTPPSHGQIIDSNSVVLRELVRAAGGEPAALGRAPDETDRLRELIHNGFECDVLCVTGGMSKGTHDLVPALAEELGVRWLVTSLHMKPGKPMRIGRAPSGCWLLGLPGNPVSCAVCFILFGRAVLDGLQGLPVQGPPHLRAALTAGMPANGQRPLYQPAEWHAIGGGGVAVTPLPWRGSGDPFGLSTANSLIHRPALAPAAPAGDSVRIVPFDVPR